MAVYRTATGETRLFLGFASGDTGARRANIFYKNVLAQSPVWTAFSSAWT